MAGLAHCSRRLQPQAILQARDRSVIFQVEFPCDGLLSALMVAVGLGVTYRIPADPNGFAANAHLVKSARREGLEKNRRQMDEHQSWSEHGPAEQQPGVLLAEHAKSLLRRQQSIVAIH